MPKVLATSILVDFWLVLGMPHHSLFIGKESLINHPHSVGFLVMIIPLYQAELCHPSIRGGVTTLQQFMLGIGALIASTTSWGTFFSFDLMLSGIMLTIYSLLHPVS